MPNIGANSLAFMLDLNSTGFTKAFKDAQNSYKSFTQSLTDLNKNLNKKGQGFLDGMAGGANITVTAYKEALTKIQAYATANPIIQPVEFVVSQQAQSALNRAAQAAASGVGPVTSGAGGGSPRAGGGGGPRTRRARQTLSQIAYAHAPGSSLASAASDLQTSLAQLLAGGPDMAALLAKTKSAQSVLGVATSGNAGAASALSTELVRINRQILTVERDLLRTTREKNKLESEERRRARMEAREADKEDRTQGRSGTNRLIGATYGLQTLSGLLNSNVLNPLGVIGGMQTSGGLAAQYGGSRQNAYNAVYQTRLLSPGASTEEANAATAAAMGVYGANIGQAGGLLTNLGRVGISNTGGANVLTASRMAGLSPEASQLLIARLGLGSRRTGTTHLAGRSADAFGRFIEEQSGMLLGMGAPKAEAYLTDANRAIIGMNKATGDTGGSEALLKLASLARDPSNRAALVLGLRKNMSLSEMVRQIQRKEGTINGILSSGNPEQYAQFGLNSQTLGALQRVASKNVDLSSMGEAGTLSDANRQLAAAADETRSALDGLTGSFKTFGAWLSANLGDAPGTSGALLNTGANLATGASSAYLAYRSLRGGASVAGAGAVAAGGGGMFARLGRWGGRIGRVLGRVLPGAAARTAGRVAAGTAASSILGPGAALVGAGLTAWGAYDLAKTGYDAITADNSSGPLGEDRVALTSAMSSVGMQLTTTNELLAKILDAVSTSQVTSPQKNAPTRLSPPPRMPTGAP